MFRSVYFSLIPFVELFPFQWCRFGTIRFLVIFHDNSICFVPFGFAPFRSALLRIFLVCLSISSPLQVSGAVTRLTVYRAATHQDLLRVPRVVWPAPKDYPPGLRGRFRVRERLRKTVPKL